MRRLLTNTHSTASADILTQDELIRLWDEHKDRFAPMRTGELEIVE